MNSLFSEFPGIIENAPRRVYSEQLAGATPIGRYLSAFFAIFWSIRVFIQLFYYDSKFKNENALGNAVFVFGFSYLAVVFSVAALGVIQ